MHYITEAIRMTAIMAWEILWALCLGFLLSAIIEACVSKANVTKLLPDSKPKTILIATALGAASSSCSYAATALARTLFRKGSDFIAAIAFQLASTNLVIEISVLIATLLGWRFMAAEFLGAPIMITLVVLFLRATLTQKILVMAYAQASKNLPGKMEGHAAMDMSLHTGTFWQKITSAKGYTATTHYYWMDWYSLWPDIAGGLIISGCLAADLIILPILNIYRKYYGLKVAALLFAAFYAAMSLSALAIEAIFSALHLIPTNRTITIMQESFRWNYTSILDIVFLIVSAVLLLRFLKTGGPAMLKVMDEIPNPDATPSCCH